MLIRSLSLSSLQSAPKLELACVLMTSAVLEENDERRALMVVMFIHCNPSPSLHQNAQ